MELIHIFGVRQMDRVEFTPLWTKQYLAILETRKNTHCSLVGGGYLIPNIISYIINAHADETYSQGRAQVFLSCVL